MKQEKSKELFIAAKKYMPGGVNSPVRAFRSVGLEPVFIKQGIGSKLYDVDDNEYIDYVCSWGPLILGHSYPQVVQAISEAAAKGTSFGACCEREVELAQLICEAIPSIDKVRLVNSGTEATMSAVRLARAYTGREKIVKFEGCYHGHADSFLIKAGSGLLTSGVPTSSGVPGSFVWSTLVARYNDTESVEKIFAEYGQEIAAVIVEPVAGNMGLVLPQPGFLENLRRITEQSGALLIFDEVISGFRTCYGGFQNLAGIVPDLTTLGKIIGGGLPVGAYGGREDIMNLVAPEGDVYQAGTLSGNPLAMAAGTATLKILKEGNCYDELEKAASLLTGKIKDVFAKYGICWALNQIGSMFSIFFNEGEVCTYEEVIKSDTDKYARFYRELLEEGIYFPPSQYEVCFVSCAHSQDDIEKTVEAIDKALSRIL